MMRRSLHILLVEDRDADAALVRNLLKSQPVVLDRVVDAEQAMAYLRGDAPYAGKHRPDLILLDLGLPAMSGHELIRAIRADSRWQTIIIVVLTASEDSRDIAEAYYDYANSVVIKPPELVDLKKLLSDLIVYWGHWNEPPP